jgi:hypothetical protein
MNNNNTPARLVACFAVSLALTLAGSAQDMPPGPTGYHLLKTIPVGGTEGWD